MKRGNTALKRGVGLASAFALAVAGAVIAAPAASAFPTSDDTAGNANTAGATPSWDGTLADVIRATPTADAVVSYSASDTTGVAPRLEVGTPDQDASGFQIQLPVEKVAAQHATWNPGDRFKINLPIGVTWAGAPTVESTGLVALESLKNNAGWKKTNVATEATPVKSAPKTAGSDGHALQKPEFSVSVDGRDLYIQITNNQWGYEPNDANYRRTSAQTVTMTGNEYSTTDAIGDDDVAIPGFLISVSDVKLSVAENSSVGAVTAYVEGQTDNGQFPNLTAEQKTPAADFVGGATTIGWVNSAKVTVGEGALDADDSAQPIPTISVAEAVTAGLYDDTYELFGAVTGKSISGYVVFDDVSGNGEAWDATSSSDTGLTAKNFTNPSDVTIAFDLTGAKANLKQAIDLENIRVAGYVNKKADIDGNLTVLCTAAAAPVAACTAAGDVVANPDYNPLKPLPQSASVQFVLDANGTTIDTRPFNFKSGQDPLASTSATLTDDSEFSFSPKGLTQFKASENVPVGAVTDRIAGPDRFETARRIAVEYAQTYGDVDGRVANIVVANGQTAKGGYDALAANFLAAQLNAPILLTNANSVPKATAAAIRQIAKPSTVIYVMGKTDSISQAVRTQLGNSASLLFENAVLEVAGTNRYATAALAASYSGTASAYTFTYGQAKLRTAFLASGESNADALAVGPLAISANVPVLLTGKARLAPQTADALVAMGIQQVVILGGEDRITKATEEALADLGVKNVVRLAGGDRYETAAMIYDLAYLGMPSPVNKEGGFARAIGDVTYLANGQAGFPDALAIGPLAGKTSSALLTVGDGAALPESTQKFLDNDDFSATSAVAVGGVDRISQSALDAANKLLG